MMLKMDAQKGAGAGGFSDVIIPTVTSGVVEADWDYDAKTIIVFSTLNNSKYLYIYNVATRQMFYAGDGYKLTNYGTDTRVTFSGGSSADTAKHCSINWGTSVTITNTCIIPLTDNPVGYFA